MIVRKIVHCIFAGTRFCCSKNAKCCKFFLNRQPPVRCEVYDRVYKENPLQRVHSCGRRLAGISETPEHSGRKGEEYGKVHTFENGKKMRVVPSLERCNGQHNDPDENEGLFPSGNDSKADLLPDCEGNTARRASGDFVWFCLRETLHKVRLLALCVNAECALWHVPCFFAKNT